MKKQIIHYERDSVSGYFTVCGCFLVKDTQVKKKVTCKNCLKVMNKKGKK